VSAASIAVPCVENPSPRAGIDPLGNVHVMENHDQAWHLWRAGGLKNRVLVHVDAHHDMWWIDDTGPITIANFICAALKEDIVREMYWVVPDGALKNAAARRALLRQVKSVARSYKADRRLIRVTPASITADIIGRKLTVCTMSSLHLTGESVLLDIDVDYLVIPQVARNRPETHSDPPWCWPADLLEGMTRAALRSDFVTISYSIEGCYTPLPWKYLGDELAMRLSRPGDDGAVAGFDRLRRAATLMQRGDLEEAERGCLEAAALLPQSAAPHYHLALLYAKLERVEEAQRHYREARELDPSYATGFNTLGLHYLWHKQYSQARTEFQRALLLNPLDGHACIGMARLAGRRKQWGSAIAWFRKALETSDEMLDAHRGLGEAYSRIDDLEAASKHYERSLQLALHGHKPLSWHILTARRPDELLDEDHCASYADLGGVYLRRGKIQKAIACYQIALSAKEVGVRQRLQLARLLARNQRWREARSHVAVAARRIPSRSRFHARRSWRRLTKGLRDWTEKLLDERTSRPLES
jgi:tetratricopeptide (TPR) repeat protein